MKIKIYNYYDYLKQGEKADNLIVNLQDYYDDGYYFSVVKALNKRKIHKIIRQLGQPKLDLFVRVEIVGSDYVENRYIRWDSDYTIFNY